jgi:ketose-bisphosphate aldolase
MSIVTLPAPTARPMLSVLATASRNRFAVGSFAPRYTSMIRPILRAGEKLSSPIIVQISQREMERYGIAPGEFGDAFKRAMDEEQPSVPVVLHLDHTFEISVIEAAIDAGFTSVMMDGSAKPFEENVAVSGHAAEIAHRRGVSIEAELGKIGTTDFVETDDDVELYTDPGQAADFVTRTGVDALAVSVGTAHGHYVVRQPKIDFERLRLIREATQVQIVLHGGSGVPAEMIQRAVSLPGGGISKVNIATDIEAALLASIGRESRMSNAECSQLPPAQRRVAEQAVEDVVMEKIKTYLLSAGKAKLFD